MTVISDMVGAELYVVHESEQISEHAGLSNEEEPSPVVYIRQVRYPYKMEDPHIAWESILIFQTLCNLEFRARISPQHTRCGVLRISLASTCINPCVPSCKHELSSYCRSHQPKKELRYPSRSVLLIPNTDTMWGKCCIYFKYILWLPSFWVDNILR